MEQERMTERDEINHYKSELDKEKEYSQKLLHTISSLENKIEKLIDQMEILNQSVIKMQNEKDNLYEQLNKEKPKKTTGISEKKANLKHAKIQTHKQIPITTNDKRKSVRP